MTTELGKLKYLKLNQVWPHEEQDFTPWLAQSENLAILSKELGLELEFERAEVPVGPYVADILAKDASGSYVIIENQFNKTNHDHLGKLITYGATLGASIVIWIAEKFSEEHVTAIEWLNERTTDDLSFFAVQPKVFQIGDSLPAVEFVVVERPNETARAAAKEREEIANLTEKQQLQLDFWRLFQKRLLEKRVIMSSQTPRPQYWFDVPLGRAGIHLSNIANTADNKLGLRVYISNRLGDTALNQLSSDRVAIENEIGAQLEWNPHPMNRDKIIRLVRDVDLENQEKWPEYVEWLVEQTAKFRATFMPRVRKLPLTQIVSIPGEA